MEPIIYKIYVSDTDKITLKTNDIVYVEVRPRYARELRNEIFPYVSLLTSTVIILNAYNRIK